MVFNFSKINGTVIAIVVAVLLAIIGYVVFVKKSSFNRTKWGDATTNRQPQQFQPISVPVPTSQPPMKLAEPDVPEEVGLTYVYPQGAGASMDRKDTESFAPADRSSQLTEHKLPEAYGSSSYVDPTGTSGVLDGARIIKLQGIGNQSDFKPIEDNEKEFAAAAYSNGTRELFIPRNEYLDATSPMDYSSNWNPEKQLRLEASPGQQTTSTGCESTYPNVVKYGDLCITEGDIPYGQVVGGKVNPRLVSRWESYTGEYSREAALQDIDGTLYPKLDKSM